MTDRTLSDAKAEAITAVLRLALAHPSLLDRPIFEELAALIHRAMPFAHMAVLTPEGDARRLYAASMAPTTPVVVVGATVPGIDVIERSVYGLEQPFYCDDTRQGNEVERRTAEAGYLSYVILPARAPRPAPSVVAELVFAFIEPGACRGVDAVFAQEIADIVGASLERGLLAARERRLAMILDTSQDAMLAWDREGRITDLNAAAVQLAGRPRADLLGSRVSDLIAPLPPRAGAAARPWGRMELHARLPDGGERRVIVSATHTEVEGDPVVCAHVLLRDLTRVVAAEREAALRTARIRELEEQHRTLLDNVPLVIFRLDPASGELVYLNRHAERLLGVPTSQALGSPGFLRDAHADPEGVRSFDAAVELARSGTASAPYDARLRVGDGEAVSARGTIYPLVSEQGEVAAIEGVLADVSTEQAARTRLVQNDRLATLGTLAAGVAHEINNPAAFILLGLDMLDRLLVGHHSEADPAGESAHDLVGELREAIRRIVDIARDLRLFSSPPRPDGARRTIVDVNRTVESALSLTRGQILDRAELVRSFDSVPPVVMDEGRLGQVVVNLLANAAQAIPRTQTGDNTIFVATRSDGRTVEIEVADTGPGIPEDNLERIWQPFFTTKTPDVATGLGLGISREIVERAGGTIRVESPTRVTVPPSGTRFLISLPAAGQGDQTTPVSSPLPALPGARARVLVVEDEAPLAKVLAEELARHHDVTVTDGAARALDALAAARFDAILCDLRMPGMGGDALYEAVLARDPLQAECFIFMTGVGFGAELDRFVASARRPVLEKPFSADAALQAIVRVVTKR